MKSLRFLSVGMLLAALNTPVLAEKEAEVAKKDEAGSAVEVDDVKKSKTAETATEETEAKKEDAAEAPVDAVTNFNAGLANLVGDIMSEEQFAQEEAEEEAAEKEASEPKSDEKVVAKNAEGAKDSKE